jgi:hypothetical protein
MMHNELLAFIDYQKETLLRLLRENDGKKKKDFGDKRELR